MTDHIAADQSGVDERAKFEKAVSKAPIPFDTTKDAMLWAWNAALSSNAAQSAGQEPVVRQYMYAYKNRSHRAEAWSGWVEYNNLHIPHPAYEYKYRDLYTHPSSAAKVEEIRNADSARMDFIENRGFFHASKATRLKEATRKNVDEAIRALKTAAPSKGEGS